MNVSWFQIIFTSLLFSGICTETANASDFMVGSGKDAEVDIGDQNERTLKYCMRFQNIDVGSIGTTITEMEATPFPVDEYFTNPQCQSKWYNTYIKSPILHIIPDDPSGRSTFLKKISIYYLKMRKAPQKFSEALNAKNTLGETFLDYIASIRINNTGLQPDQLEALADFEKLACASGGVYAKHKLKSCEASVSN